MTSRHPACDIRGNVSPRRVGNLWPDIVKPGTESVRIDGMDTLAARGAAEGDAEIAALLQTSFEGYRDKFPQLDHIVERLERAGATCVVIGGWARDTIIGLEPHDVDLVVVGADTDVLKGTLPAASRRTALGGFSFEYPGVEIDLWCLQDTHLIRQLGVQPSLQALMRVIDFNVNAVLFTPAQLGAGPRLLDGGMSDSLLSREIDFNCGVLPLPIAQVSRLAYFSTKLDFALSSRVRRFMYEQCVVRDLQGEVEANLLQYCPPRLRQHALDALHAAVSTLC